MSDKKHELLRVAETLVADISRGAKEAADKLLGDQGGPDSEKVTRQQEIDHVRALWPHPDLRASFIQRMAPSIPNPYAQAPDGSDAVIPAKNGVEYLEKLIEDAFPFGWPEPPMGGVLAAPVAPMAPVVAQPAGVGGAPPVQITQGTY
jgi:hypothetical protein